jgi:hypothetical protein
LIKQDRKELVLIWVFSCRFGFETVEIRFSALSRTEIFYNYFHRSVKIIVEKMPVAGGACRGMAGLVSGLWLKIPWAVVCYPLAPPRSGHAGLLKALFDSARPSSTLEYKVRHPDLSPSPCASQGNRMIPVLPTKPRPFKNQHRRCRAIGELGMTSLSRPALITCGEAASIL